MPQPRPMLPRHPLPDWLQRSIEHYAGRVPLWLFPPLGPAADLQFERLDFDNRDLVLAMFENDDSPFVDAAFKDDRKLYEYVAHQRICGPYSPKHGCADWIVKGASGTPVALLNAYDISRETWGLNNRHCSIGYAVAAGRRGTGLADAAVAVLEAYLFETFDQLMLLAYPRRGNTRSIRFLERRGYIERTQDYHGRDQNRYFVKYRSPEARQQMEHRYDRHGTGLAGETSG